MDDIFNDDGTKQYRTTFSYSKTRLLDLQTDKSAYLHNGLYPL